MSPKMVEDGVNHIKLKGDIVFEPVINKKTEREVKYFSGAIGGVRPDTNVIGFGDPAYYDNVRSSLARPGSTQTVLGQGGLLDAGIGIVEDLQSGGVAGVIGAIQKAGTAYNTWKDAPIRSVVSEEANAALNSVLRNTIPAQVRQAQNANGGFVFPRPPTNF